MTDYFTDWKLGEHRGPISEYIDVEYAGDIKAGDILKISGANDDGQWKVQKQTGATFEVGVAQHDGKSGDFQTIVRKGFVKVKVTTTSADNAIIPAGTVMRVMGGVIRSIGTSGAGRSCAVLTKALPAHTAGNAEHETVVFFESQSGGAPV